MPDNEKLTTAAGAPVPDNQNVMTAGPRGPMLLQDVWFLEKLAHFDREVIPEGPHAMGDAPKEVKVRHIRNCTKADPAYGEGVAKALGIPLNDVQN